MDARGNIRIIFEDVAENDRVIVAGFNDGFIEIRDVAGYNNRFTPIWPI